MKKLFIVLLCATPLIGMSQQNFSLHATIPAVPDGTTVFLISSKQYTSFKDSAIINKGVVAFKGDIPEPSKAVLRIEKGGKITSIVHFYLEPATLQMKSADSLSNGKITN